jgi:hypothetical protein
MYLHFGTCHQKITANFTQSFVAISTRVGSPKPRESRGQRFLSGTDGKAHDHYVQCQSTLLPSQADTFLVMLLDVCNVFNHWALTNANIS